MGTCVAKDYDQNGSIQASQIKDIKDVDQHSQLQQQTSQHQIEVQKEVPLQPQIDEQKNQKIIEKSQDQSAIAIQSAFRQKQARKALREQKEILEEDKPKNWKLSDQQFSIPELPKVFQEKVNKEITNDNRKLQPYISSDGTIYDGQWKKGLQNGYGIMIKPDKTYIEGQWKEGQYEEVAILFHNGDIYLGTKTLGVREYKNGSNYSGQTLNELPHGEGVLLLFDGTKYEGQFVNGLQNGSGKTKFINGSIYEGQYKNGQIEGNGTFHWNDGSVYNGQWHNSQLHGKGIFKYSDGRIYEGDFYEDKKQGNGIMKYVDHSEYQGQFVNNRRHGLGKIKTISGQIIELQWSEGIPVVQSDTH